MYQEILDLLNTKKGRFREIAKATGLDYDWLHQVARGKINDPGIKKMEQLHAYLLSMEDPTTTAA